jgi:hypothetical protein
MDCEVVSANITDASGKLMFKDRITKSAGRVTVGITGVTSKSLFENIPPSQKSGDAAFGFKDAFESLKPVVKELSNQTDVVVVLAHVGAADARRMAEEIPEVNVIVAGHMPGFFPAPDKIGEVLILRHGMRGQHCGKLTLTLGPDKTIADFKGQVDELNTGFKSDVAIETQVSEFQAESTRKQLQRDREKLAESTSGNKFLGDEICARCHSDIYARWAEKPHARAFQSLVSVNKQGDRTCVACHVTGFGDATGYQLMVVHEKSARNDTTDSPKFRNVQCESCHGMGTGHGTDQMITKVKADACLTCHDASNDPDFDFEKALAAGAHH